MAYTIVLLIAGKFNKNCYCFNIGILIYKANNRMNQQNISKYLSYQHFQQTEIINDTLRYQVKLYICLQIQVTGSITFELIGKYFKQQMYWILRYATREKFYMVQSVRPRIGHCHYFRRQRKNRYHYLIVISKFNLSIETLRLLHSPHHRGQII